MGDDNCETLHIKEFTPEMIKPDTNEMYDKKSWGTKMVVIGKPACFEKGTTVLMHDGRIKNVEDVNIGDKVMGDDSTPRNVLALSRGTDVMYRITPKIGEPIVVNKNHMLTIVKIKGGNKGQLIDISVEEYIKLTAKIKLNYNWIRVPIQFKKIIQKIDPYILGFFIDGDYSFIKREFVKKHFLITDNYIDKLIEKNVPTIPNNILYSDIQDRAQYLAGLLDSKATYNVNTKRFDISLSSEDLCDQVMYLAGSVGYYTSKIKNFKSNFFTQTQQIMWSCYIYVNTNTQLASKIFDINYIKTMFGGMFTTDFYITEVGMGEYYGFNIDGNHRFLLGDFSLTHNSGKCMGEGTPVLKFDGTICPIEDIKKDDILMGDAGQPQIVLSTCQGHGDLYSVYQGSGDTYIVNSNHILTIKCNNEIKDICVTDLVHRTGKYKHFGIKNSNIEFNVKETTVEPYERGKKLDIGVDDLRDYVINGHHNRLKFLSGIVDAYGKYDVKNHSIVLKLPETVDATLILFLIRTLQFTAFYRRGKITFYGKLSVLDIDSDVRTKFNRVFSTKTRLKIRYIGPGKYYGFELSGNRRYTLGDCTITHNTYAITSLLYQKRHIFPVGLVFSGTEKVTGYWGKIFPSSFVYPNLQLSRVQDFLQRQEISKKHLPNPWAVLLIDDCAFEGKLFKSELFKELFCNGRHYKFWLILSLQTPSDIQPHLRTNIDYTFIYKNNNFSEREKIYKNYASVIPTFKMFNDIMDLLTEDFTALVINNLSQSNNLEDCIFWFRAPPYPDDFKFGSTDYWNHHYVRCNENEV